MGLKPTQKGFAAEKTTVGIFHNSLNAPPWQSLNAGTPGEERKTQASGKRLTAEPRPDARGHVARKISFISPRRENQDE